MKIPPWYVLTGGPSCGKTTLLRELQKLGLVTFQETARVLIDEYKKRGISVQELRKDDVLFQQRVLEMKLDIEKKAPKDKVIFFDRGVPDSIPYYKLCGLDTKELERISRNRYKRIFFLEQLPFQQDYARVEDGETVRKLNRLLLESYENLGYKVIIVPVMPVKKRLQLVLSWLEKDKSEKS